MTRQLNKYYGKKYADKWRNVNLIFAVCIIAGIAADTAINLFAGSVYIFENIPFTFGDVFCLIKAALLDFVVYGLLINYIYAALHKLKLRQVPIKSFFVLLTAKLLITDIPLFAVKNLAAEISQTAPDKNQIILNIFPFIVIGFAVVTWLFYRLLPIRFYITEKGLKESLKSAFESSRGMAYFKFILSQFGKIIILNLILGAVFTFFVPITAGYSTMELALVLYAAVEIIAKVVFYCVFNNFLKIVLAFFELVK